MTMRLAIRSLFLAALLFLAAPDLLADEGPPLQGEFQDFTLLQAPVPAPDTRFFDGQELPVSLADFRGRVVLLNFWATWCPPCVFEMPSLDALQEALGPEGLSVVAVSLDRQGLEIVAPFLRDLAVRQLEAYIDPRGRLAAEFEVSAMPTSFVIDARGRIVGALRGAAAWDSPEALALLRYYLEKTAPSDETPESGVIRTGG
ncbi:MAG: TlpA disulfide reductase family protein [Rhodovibrionaceae bacterium]